MTPTLGAGGASRFSETRFRASVQDMKFMAQGDIRLTLNIPFSDRAAAVAVADAYGLVLNVTIERKRK